MPVPQWGSGWVSFVVSHRIFVSCLIAGLFIVGAWQSQHVSLSAKITDYYPTHHPHVRLYREFAEMLKIAGE